MDKCLYCCAPLNGATDYHEDCSKHFFGTTHPPLVPFALDDLNDLSGEEGHEVLAIPGEQTKRAVSFAKTEKDTIEYRMLLDIHAGNYLLLVPDAADADLAANEHTTMRLAAIFGIPTTETALMRLASGELVGVAKRFDRDKNGTAIPTLKLAHVTAATQHANDSFESIGAALDLHATNSLLDKTYVLDWALFAFLTGNTQLNRDNFTLVEGRFGWYLSPGHDWTSQLDAALQQDSELALTIGGKNQHLKRSNFEALGESLGLNPKQIRGAFNRLEKNKAVAFDCIERSFLSPGAKEAYKQCLQKRYQQLGMGSVAVVNGITTRKNEAAIGPEEHFFTFYQRSREYKLRTQPIDLRGHNYYKIALENIKVNPFAMRAAFRLHVKVEGAIPITKSFYLIEMLTSNTFSDSVFFGKGKYIELLLPPGATQLTYEIELLKDIGDFELVLSSSLVE